MPSNSPEKRLSSESDPDVVAGEWTVRWRQVERGLDLLNESDISEEDL